MLKQMKKFLFKNKANVLILLFAVLGFFIFSSLFTYLYFAKDLHSKESIMNRNNTGIVLTDRNDVPFFTFYSAHTKTFVPLSDIPDFVKEAVIAAEDKNFYSHPGFSIEGIVRAAIYNISQQDVVAGGSTITQQLVKNSLLTPHRNFLRKFQEVVLAQEIERRYSKDEILAMYLNSVYFGNGAFGIEEAAQRYFGKPASQLSLAESSMLVGILPAPSRYSPFNESGRAAKARQQYVLTQMVQVGSITEDQRKETYNEELVFATEADDINTTAPHFAVMVRDSLIEKYGEENIIRSGYKVKTSLDLEMQKFAESVVATEVKNLENNNVSNGAAVVIDPKTGELLSLVGSSDWFNEEFGRVNVATQTRQPGSSFKPLVYAIAMEEHKITPATVLHDKPTTFANEYKPNNYDNRFRGNVLVRRALANSLNVPAVEVMTMLDLEHVLERVEEFGITTLAEPVNYGPSLVLGTGEVRLTELTGVYAMFANHGKKNDVTAILSITNKRGESVYEYTPQNKQVISPQVSFLISSILSDNSARAEVFGSTLNISRTAAVKTGTTENYRDALTVGYTPQLAVGVWVGNNDGTPMDQIAGSLGAAPIWRQLMEEFHQEKPEIAFEPPENVIAVSVCSYNGLLARSDMSGKIEYFLSGTQPTRRCTVPRIARDDFNFFEERNDEEISDELRRHREVVRDLLREMREQRSEERRID